MHSEHRRQYHLRTLAEAYPGDRVSLDAEAIAAVIDDRREDVDWDRVDADASQVIDRHRYTPDRLSLEVRGKRGAGIEGHTAATLLVARPANPFC
jgi:hypothetical protein